MKRKIKINSILSFGFLRIFLRQSAGTEKFVFSRFRILISLVLFFLFYNAYGQILTPLSNELNQRVEYNRYLKGVSFFSVWKPYFINELTKNQDSTGISGNSLNTLTGFDALPAGPKKKSWLERKLFYESLVEVDSGDFHLFFDPLFDFCVGKDNSGRKIFTNTRGFNAGGQLGNHFAFETSFYENQAIFPSWINSRVVKNTIEQGKGIVPGQGRGRMHGEIWDYAHAEGYVSFSPVSALHIQLGQGKNFIGDGYRSLLLSDAAYNYPYARITWETKKFMYSWMLGVIQDLSITHGNDQYTFGKRLISTHLLAYNVSPRIQLSVIKCTVYNNPDTVGNFTPGFAELNPLILPVNNNKSHSIWGLNLKLKLTSLWYLYGQGVLDNLFSKRPVYSGLQLGTKCFDVLGLKGCYLQTEYNRAEPMAYSSNDRTLNWLHYREPLAHPYGQNFEEIVVNLSYLYKRFQVKTQSNYARPVKEGAIFTGTPSLTSYNKLMLVNMQLNYYINPKTLAHISVGATLRREWQAGSILQQSYIYIALRTNLQNLYYDF
jgi:hypothetical protein